MTAHTWNRIGGIHVRSYRLLRQFDAIQWHYCLDYKFKTAGLNLILIIAVQKTVYYGYY